MSKKLITITKIILGILSIIIPFKILVYLAQDYFQIHNYDQLKWFVLLICFIGFCISGFINNKTSLKLIPILYTSLLLFIPLRSFYFPLIFYLFLFATIGLLLTRREISRKIKIASSILVSCIFIYFLISQALVIRLGDAYRVDQYGDLINGKTIWDFTEKKSIKLPESVFMNTSFNSFDLKSIKNKTIYISFWATWCEPCHLEKPALDKLKASFANNDDIVFIDISLDIDKNKWKEYVKTNKPSGIQLISKNDGKSRNLFNLNGIPEHVVINQNWDFEKSRSIRRAYMLLSDPKSLNDFIYGNNRKLNLSY